MALKVMDPAQPAVMERGHKNSKGAHLSLLRQRQNITVNDSTDQGKTKYT